MLNENEAPTVQEVPHGRVARKSRRRHGADPFDLPICDGLRSFSGALEGLERSTKKIAGLRGTARNGEELFTSVVNGSRNCRTAFVLWDIEENLHGVSPDRKRLALAMQECRRSVRYASNNPGLKDRRDLIRRYLNAIDRRIALLNVAMTGTWGDYEKRKQEFLKEALCNSEGASRA